MIVKCSSCNASYSVDDNKVKGKKFGFECPKCGESIVIDNREEIPSPVIEEEAKAPEFDLGFDEDKAFSEHPHEEWEEPEAEIDLSVLSKKGAFEEPSAPEFDLGLESKESAPSEEEDESITIDLNSLDIPLEESGEYQSGEVADEVTFDEEEGRLSVEDAGINLDEITQPEPEPETEESRLSLEDVGISIDELQPEEEIEPLAINDEDELKLTLDEVSPGMDIESFADENAEEMAAEIEEPGRRLFQSEEPVYGEEPLYGERTLDREFEESPLPEIDFEAEEHKPHIPDEDSYLCIEESVECDEDEYQASGKGYLNFSVDYSLKYSRVRALLRLVGLYAITLIPHFLVLAVYSILSAILMILNSIVVLISGKQERDFAGVHEKMLRYSMGIYSSIVDIIEERPQRVNDNDIDYPLQLKVIYPAKPSKFLSFMRLSVVGIQLMLLPHYILYSILSFGVALLYVVALLHILIAKRWPPFLFDFMIRYIRYGGNIYAYGIGMIDNYPSFRFD